MKKKILYLVALSIILNLMIFVASCCVPGACCSGDSPSTFDILDMSAQNVSINATNSAASGAAELADQSTISAEEYGIWLIPEIVYSSIDKPNLQMQGFLINTAYACTPPLPVSDEEVSTIAVFSDADFIMDGQTFAAGDTLNNLFNIRDNNTWEDISLDLYNSNQAEDKIATEYEHLLKLIESPVTPQNHRFTIHYSQTNGEFYSMETQSVEITP